MMIRTYKSKKETGGGLDRKDLLQNVDEKSSDFNAFSIKNIKKTKRELSCVSSTNPYNVASNKVRKRKYVKRIIKEVEIRPRESLSKSAYLTPDKSLRVNKPLDPFDMLLNSSPVCLVDAAGDQAQTVSKKVDLFKETVATKERKTYRRKKPIKAKKCNFSSSQFDSDKENSDEQIDITKNMSNIKTHKLFVEQEVYNSPKQFDDSINKIVKNLSLLNRIQLKNSLNESMKKSLSFGRNRLTSDVQSPILQKSPLCSTPFKAKYRGGSIFKFSPISVATNEKSPKSEDDGNSSVIFIRKNISSRIIEENSFIKNVTTNNSIIECNEILETNKVQSYVDDAKYETNEHDFKDSKIIVSKEISSYLTTEIEPFIGFSSSEINKLDNVKYDLAIKIKQKDSGLEKDIFSNVINDSVSEKSNDMCGEVALLDNDVPKAVHGSIFTENNEIINEVVKIPDIYNKEAIEENNENSISIVSETSDGNNSLSESSENESFYDTCSSDRSSISKFATREPVIQIERMNDSAFLKYYEEAPVYSSISKSATREPVIQIEKMNDSDFLRYYEKMPMYKSDEENDSGSNDSLTDDSEEFASLNNSNSSDKEKSLKEIENNILETETIENSSSETDTDIYSCPDNISSSDDDLEYNSDSGDKCVSFVTTRRRNEVTNNSIMSIFEHSYDSSCTDCDKTVLSNSNEKEKINALQCIDKLDINKSSNGSDEVSCKDSSLKNDQDIKVAEDTRISFIKTKKSSIAARKSSIKPTKSQIRKTDNRTVPIETLIKTGSNESLHDTSDKLVGNTSCKDTIPKSELKFTEDFPRMSFITNRKSSFAARKSNIKAKKTTLRDSRSPSPNDTRKSTFDIKQGIVLQPGKKWERSLSIYRRMTMMTDHFDQSILEDEAIEMKGRKYRQSVISTMEMQDLHGSLHNESINSRRSTFISKPSRSTIRIVKDPSNSSACNTTVFDDLKGFLNEECDDTIVDLSKLSIADQAHEVTVIDNFHDTSNRIATARDYVLRRCNQADTILFDECYPDSLLKNCHKIGEGVYGEVFLWRARDGRARVLKIVPIAGRIKVNGECQKDYHEIISEIVIAMELSALRAPIADIQLHFDEGKEVDALDLHAIENATDVFNEVLAVRCVYGSYPSRLLDLWDLFDECKGSENDNPAILPVDQQYIVLELANAGQDLESYQFNNAEQAHALFLQVAYGLAVGEEAFQFEHRDLHWGNVLIAPTEQKFSTFVIRGRSHRVARCGVAATIIDYSLSRVALPLAGERAALYNDLAADESLFDAVGDHQFEVYRLMRDKLGNDWKNFEPYTNILWLHYTVDKMITALRYKRTNTRIHKHYIEKLKGIKERILAYGSAALFVLTDNEI